MFRVAPDRHSAAYIKFRRHLFWLPMVAKVAICVKGLHCDITWHGVRTMHSAPNGKVCTLCRTRKCAANFNV